MSFNLDSNKRWGIIGTVVFHIALLLILFMLSMKPPYPPRPEIGLEVNLGYSDQGMGEIQPKKAAVSEPKKTKPQPQKTDDKVVTQNTEESINLKSSKTTKKVETKPKEPEKPVVDKKYIFSKKSDSQKGGSEGITNKPGDQGEKNGTPNSNNYVGGGGSGDIPYSLGGRIKKSIPKPVNNSEEQGTVVVKIWVNRDGKVTNARVQVKGTTTSNSQLQNIAIKAALKASFNSDPKAPEVQTGTITYVFVI
jgi:TonB family protein